MTESTKRERSMNYKSTRAKQTTEDTDYNSGEYRPAEYQRHCARCAEKLRVIGATRAEVAKFFGVEILTVDEWERQHKDFDWALQTEPTTLGVTSEDFGLYNWLKDYRRGLLEI
jgi:hypothetical protein